MKFLFQILLCCSMATACQSQEKAVMESRHAALDVTLDTNPSAPFWRAARPIYAEVDASGHALPEYHTEIRSRWTNDSIYFLFVCPYQHLYVKPQPDSAHETYELWNWNVAEVFIGSDFKDIKRYKEFEVSPQNEWIDLDVNLHNPHHEGGWVWNSGFEHSARIDESKRIWYVAMRIPFGAIDKRAPAAGMTFRMNLYRTEGLPASSKEIMWQPVMSSTFHVPDKFGLLRLTAK